MLNYTMFCLVLNKCCQSNERYWPTVCLYDVPSSGLLKDFFAFFTLEVGMDCYRSRGRVHATDIQHLCLITLQLLLYSLPSIDLLSRDIVVDQGSHVGSRMDGIILHSCTPSNVLLCLLEAGRLLGGQ